MNPMTYLFALAFVGIMGALLFAGIAMVRKPQAGAQKRKSMARALAVRVGLSVLLFAFIWIAHYAGWIQPTGLPVR